MPKQINNLLLTQNYSKPKMNTSFKANPVGKIKTLERMPVTDILSKTDKNKIVNPLLAFSTFILSGFGISNAINSIKENKKKRALQNIEHKFAVLQNDIPRVQQTFKEVFLREELTEEETVQILNKYKELEKIKVTGSRKEYVYALFEIAKQNYGFSAKSTKLIYDDKLRKAKGKSDVFNNFICVSGNKPDDLFRIVHHELRHTKQFELIYNSNPRIFDYMFACNIEQNQPKTFEKIIKTFSNGKKLNDEEIIELLIKYLPGEYENDKKNFGKLSPDNIPTSQKELAKNLAESYVNVDHDKYDKSYTYYQNCFFERDAFEAEKKIVRLLK